MSNVKGLEQRAIFDKDFSLDETMVLSLTYNVQSAPCRVLKSLFSIFDVAGEILTNDRQ